MSRTRDGDTVLSGGRLNPLAREIPLPGLAGDIAMDRESAERSLVALVLTVVELLRQLMERQAIRRVDQGDLDESQVEEVGATLMALERRMDEICDYFDLTIDDLNLDLGPLGPLLPRDLPLGAKTCHAGIDLLLPGSQRLAKEAGMVTGAVAAAAAAHAANIEGWLQIGELALALVLSAAIGLEREIRQKNAGLRTHTLVGVGAALFMLISKYGFTDILQQRLVVLDPSRVAAQIVSGIGFIGAGLIFVRRDSVRGLTTAASIWLTAAVGAAAGAGLPLLAVLATAIYLVVALAFSAVTRRLPLSATAISALHVRYPDGHGILRRVLQQATELGFAIDEVSTETVRRRPPAPALAARGPRDTLPDIRPAYVPDTGPAALETLPADPPDGSRDGQPTVEVTLHVHGRRSVSELAAALSEIDHVEAVLASDANAIDE